VNAPLITPEPPDPLVEDTQAFWRDAGKTLVRDSLGTLDETAKQLIAVSGILVGLYFHAIAFGDLKGKVSGWAQVIYLAPIVLLLFCLLFSLIVFYPDRSRLNLNSWQASKLVYERALRGKLLAVRLASLFLLLGVVAIALAALTYVRG
jgi:hypothetical protein